MLDAGRCTFVLTRGKYSTNSEQEGVPQTQGEVTCECGFSAVADVPSRDTLTTGEGPVREEEARGV